MTSISPNVPMITQVTYIDPGKVEFRYARLAAEKFRGQLEAQALIDEARVDVFADRRSQPRRDADEPLEKDAWVMVARVKPGSNAGEMHANECVGDVILRLKDGIEQGLELFEAGCIMRPTSKQLDLTI